MGETVALRTVDKKKSTKSHNISLLDTAVKETKEWLDSQQTDKVGFIVVAYSKPEGNMSSIINYCLADGMDAYALPEFVKARIINLRDGN